MRMNSEERKRKKEEGGGDKEEGRKGGNREEKREGEKGSNSGIKVNSNALFMALCVKISFTCAVLTHGS